MRKPGSVRWKREQRKRAQRVVKPRAGLVEPLTQVPEPPELLGDEGRAAWERIGGELVQRRVLTGLDLDALTMLCAGIERLTRMYPRLHAAEEAGAEEALELHQIVHGLSGSVLAIAREFGLSPASRARLGWPHQLDGGDDRTQLKLRFFAPKHAEGA
jgi:P27 family predicted phage terminase small subunit